MISSLAFPQGTLGINNATMNINDAGDFPFRMEKCRTKIIFIASTLKDKFIMKTIIHSDLEAIRSKKKKKD